MTGRTHAQIGFASVVAATALLPLKATVIGISVIPVIGIISSIVGGKFPDLDHKKSPYGKKLKYIREFIFKLGLILTICSSALIIVTLLGKIKVVILEPFYITTLGIGIVLITLGYMSGSLKHRGISHTLLFPAVLACISYVFGVIYNFGIYSLIINSLIFGFNIGMISHILADALNGKGVPLLWPLSPSRIHFMELYYGGIGEKAIIMLMYGIAVFAVLGRFISSF